MKISLSTAFLTLALAAAPAQAASFKAGDLTIDSPWARATPKGAEVAAGYLTIENHGAIADRLTGVAADFATAQLHEMKMNGGVMEMREIVGGLEIPAHGVVKLAPGGSHLMFVGLKHPLARGETVKVMLTFEHAGQVTADLPVLGVGSSGPGGSMMKGMKM
jgi:periplasmic copper chaperone A